MLSTDRSPREPASIPKASATKSSRFFALKYFHLSGGTGRPETMLTVCSQVWMQLHPDQREALESPVTVVKKVEQAAQYPVRKMLTEDAFVVVAAVGVWL